LNEERLMQVLLGPVVSEKSTRLADISNQVVFKVLGDANKTEIKAAVEKLFKVDVISVQVLNVRGKIKRSGKNWGMRSNSKKAYVRLKEGQDIDFLGGNP
jgi:large subunit ribosomal protein L23